MRLGDRPFKPTLAGTFATLVLLPVLISLGFWQLRRSEEKRVIIDQFAGGAVITESLSTENIAQLPLLQHVVVEGRFDSQKQILLDNMPASKDAAGFSKPGYRVLTPLQIDRHIVLIDRGWVPLGATRAELPNVQVTDRMRTIHGRLADLPRAGIRLSGEPAPQTWPRVLNFPTLAELQALYGETLLPRIVLLDPQDADGFRRDWSNRYSVGEFGPDKHIGYAVQWFGLAFALLVIYIVVGFKQGATPSDNSLSSSDTTP
jgi:surfeit locus 1 family protein